MDDRWTALTIAFPFAWIAGLIAVSVVLRRRQGKPIIPRVSKTALFSEAMVSGRSDGLRAFGGARNCLFVAVERDALTIVPFFPFNLMMIADIWGLEQTIPRHDVIRVERGAGLFREKVVVRYRRNLDERSFTLYLRDAAAFERAMAPGRR
jgi:hypothetical protein